MLKVTKIYLKELFVKKNDQTGFSIVEALLILAVISILGFTGWFVYHAKQSSDKSYSAASSSGSSSATKQAKTQHGTKVVSLDGTYEKYTNYDTGVSITYSKMVADYGECSGTTPKTVSLPVKIYDDAGNGKVYAAASTYAFTVPHQISPGAWQGNDSCTVKDVTLSDIEKPVSSTIPQPKVVNAEFDYAKVKSEAELDAFVTAHAPEGMVIDRSVVPTRSNGVSTYKLKGTDYAGVYFLKYNSSKKVAVFWHKLNVQAPNWADVDSSGGFVGINEPTADL